MSANTHAVHAAETTGGEWLANRRVLVVCTGLDVISGVSAGLVERGARVALLTDSESALTATPAAVERFRATFAVRDDVERAVSQVVERFGVPDLVVLSALPLEATRPAAVSELGEQEWRAGASDGIRVVLHLLQALGGHLKSRGGAIVILAPSLSLVGCRQLVAMTTALEGQRGLMKSVARQWGHTGVTLNWIAAAPRALSHAFDAAPLASKPDAVTVALGQPPDPRVAIAPILGFLASPAGRVVTGATLTLDGGEWMVP